MNGGVITQLASFVFEFVQTPAAKNAFGLWVAFDDALANEGEKKNGWNYEKNVNGDIKYNFFDSHETSFKLMFGISYLITIKLAMRVVE